MNEQIQMDEEIVNNSNEQEQEAVPPVEEKKIHEHHIKVNNCPVRAVKVYNSLAEITRVLKVQLIPGEQAIVLEKVPRTIKKDSVRVAGAGECDSTVLEVLYRDRDEEVIHDQTRRHELEKSIEEATLELNTLNAAAGRIKNEQQFVEHYAQSITDVNSKNVTQVSKLTQKETLDNVSKFMEFYKNQLSRVDQELYKLENDIDQKKSEIEELKKELAKQKPEKTTDTHREIVILVQAAQEGEALFIVTYIVKQASWRASYDIRVSSADNSISLTYYGVIKQNTREHWKNVMISLSTASPENRSDPPELPGLTLAYQVEFLSQAKSVKKSSFGGNKLFSLAGGGSSLNALSKSSVVQASVEQGSTSTTYTINKESTIPSDNQDHKVTIGVINLSDALFSYYSVPKKEPVAYLKVKAINQSAYSFLGGPMNVFFDNNFVTTTRMEAVNPQEEFESFLGRDPAVKVSYDPPSKFRETKGIFGGTNKSTVKRRIVVKNKKSVPIQMAVSDQFPMVYDSRVVVEHITPKIALDETLENVPILFGDNNESGKKTAEKLVRNSENNLEWTFQMEAGHSIAIPIEYTVAWPSDYEISDL